MESFTLPDTGILVGYPKARLVRPSGSPVRRGVVPDIILDIPVVQDSSDPVLQQVVKLIRTASVERRSR